MSPPDQSAHPGPEPTRLLDVIRWDVLVLVVALAALALNLLLPDVLSPALTVFLALACAWIGYRIIVKVKDFRARD